MRRTNLNRTTVAVTAAVLALVAIISVYRTMHAKPPGAGSESPEVRGKMVFDQTCSECHLRGLRETRIGPGLKGLFERKRLPVSGRPVSEEMVRRQISDPFKDMPDLGAKLSDQQISDVIAYLKTL